MMKQQLMIYLAGGAVAVGMLYFVWLCIRDSFGFIGDLRMRKELDRMKVDTEARRVAKREEFNRRLDNGCDHVWDTAKGALPANVCRLCGIQKEKPSGGCDHVWRVEKGLMPMSKCEKCEEHHNGVLVFEETTKKQPEAASTSDTVDETSTSGEPAESNQLLKSD